MMNGIYTYKDLIGYFELFCFTLYSYFHMDDAPGFNAIPG